ncbi:MAG: isoprenylcysteine carboxylmethyltransferase family protein [Candidatus Acidiferrales bacterium]
MMRATEFEFRQRFFCIGCVFGLGFFCYSFDHVTAAFAVAHLLGGKSLNLDSPAGMRALHLIFGFGAVLCILAALIRTWAAAYLHSEIVHDHALHSENLVADGPYRHVRNPLYIGGVLLGAGIGLMASRTGWFVITLGLFVFYHRLIFREEAALTASQGESFRAFCARVPRFFPALLPRVDASGAPPRWSQAFAGEVFMWGFAAAVVAFAVTLSLTVFYVVIGVGFAAYFVYWLIARRARQKSQKPPATA